MADAFEQGDRLLRLIAGEPQSPRGGRLRARPLDHQAALFFVSGISGLRRAASRHRLGEAPGDAPAFAARDPEPGPVFIGQARIGQQPAELVPSEASGRGRQRRDDAALLITAIPAATPSRRRLSNRVAAARAASAPYDRGTLALARTAARANGRRSPAPATDRARQHALRLR